MDDLIETLGAFLAEHELDLIVRRKDIHGRIRWHARLVRRSEELPLTGMGDNLREALQCLCGLDGLAIHIE